MATDFAAYANLRFLWPQPAAITTLRNGMPSPAALVVIEVFAKGETGSPEQIPSLHIGTRTMEGYITRWAPLPSGASWLASGSSWSWTDTGLMPTGLAAEARGKAYLGPLDALPTLGGLVGEVTIMQLGGTFGIGGIGAELRTALGDAIRLQFATVQ